VAIPVKLPAPDEGTEAQPEPKSVVDALAADAEDEAIDDEDIDDEAGAAAELLELPELLHAAAPTARPAATTDTARVRVRIVTPCILLVFTGDNAVLGEVVLDGWLIAVAGRLAQPCPAEPARPVRSR
jgi:hypothetical protein